MGKPRAERNPFTELGSQYILIQRDILALLPKATHDAWVDKYGRIFHDLSLEEDFQECVKKDDLIGVLKHLKERGEAEGADPLDELQQELDRIINRLTGHAPDK